MSLLAKNCPSDRTDQCPELAERTTFCSSSAVRILTPIRLCCSFAPICIRWPALDSAQAPAIVLLERSAAIFFEERMEHRRFLAHPEAHRPFVGSNLFARIGGPAVVGVLVDGLYDRIENDAALAPLFSRDLTRERKALSRFFAEWLGGESNYSSTTHLPLKHRHDLLPITRVLADKWLAHFRD